ncbi:Uncharacterized protein M832_00160 [Chlamydia avium 10DC88]|uniref:Uncharacterized protein n=1 Tax=Chlamydia avium 10DC88 TaxID=1229831 RepID=W8JFD6_9CHLA|nr:Uncharacterized protein M832_00160 [Chlamydia avium 10DC88]
MNIITMENKNFINSFFIYIYKLTSLLIKLDSMSIKQKRKILILNEPSSSIYKLL